MNHFEVFGLERKLGLDAAALQQRFYELSREHHPDFHQTAPAAQQARVLETSARVNAAYRTLRDPIKRVQYLVRLEEAGEGAAEAAETESRREPAPPDLLAEMFEIQEALQEARMGGLDEATRATLLEQREALIERRAAEEAEITGPLSEAWDRAGAEERPKLVAQLKQALARRAYFRTVIDDLTEALEGSGEGHVAHHRH
jgi:molecular chaperone HscB